MYLVSGEEIQSVSKLTSLYMKIYKKNNLYFSNNNHLHEHNLLLFNVEHRNIVLYSRQ